MGDRVVDVLRVRIWELEKSLARVLKSQLAAEAENVRLAQLVAELVIQNQRLKIEAAAD